MAISISWLVTNQFPQQVYQFASATQILGIIVCFMICYLGYKAYQITKDRKYKYFFNGFLFLGLSFLANITLKTLLQFGYAKYFIEKRYELALAPFFLGYYFFLIGTMLAYASFAVLYSDIKRSNKVWLFYFWTVVAGIYTFRNEVLFNLFSAMLLSFTVLFTYEKYTENRNKDRLKVFWAFLSLFLFHALVIFQTQIPVFFVIRNIMLLTGLVLLLITLLKIHGRTKK